MENKNEDFLFREDLKTLSPAVAELISLEQERQIDKLIMIPSESYAPKAVREALGSVFQNIYAEGYPRRRMMNYDTALLKDWEYQLAYYHRYSDRRFYKGTEFADIVESLAGRLAAECFSNPNAEIDDIFANVQALSGSAANLEVYDALLEDGDTIMGMDLFQGGHLTHGSEFNQSGKKYRVVSYGISRETGKLNYDEIQSLAQQFNPKLIIAGYTSYSWAPDFRRFREIADSVGAFLFADIAHTAGLVLGGVYPNPVGIADITVFTTHKTLGGQRGAVILTTDFSLSEKIDTSVFPGSQGGPHVNKMAALCAAFEIAKTDKFRELQKQTVLNAQALAQGFESEGLKVVYGGTDTHIVLVDVSSAVPGSKIPLYGEPAARILDLAGIVVNKNTIPGDTKTALAKGLRFGTPWVTQRGLRETHMEEIARASAELFKQIIPFTYRGMGHTVPRGKIPCPALRSAEEKITGVIKDAGSDVIPAQQKQEISGPCIKVSGPRTVPFLNSASTTDMYKLSPGKWKGTLFFDSKGVLVTSALMNLKPLNPGENTEALLFVSEENRQKAFRWLKDLSAGYTVFDENDCLKKIEGPVKLVFSEEEWDGEMPQDNPKSGSGVEEAYQQYPQYFDISKAYFIGCGRISPKESQAKQEWKAPEPGEETKTTLLYDRHVELGGKMVPFGGYSMPVWYTSASEEHEAVRRKAGLFDVSHMGCFEVSGKEALPFLDLVNGNYAGWLQPGESCYSHFFDISGGCIDDLMIYCVGQEKYILVVNAGNEDKDWDWLNSVKNGGVLIDAQRPWVEGYSDFSLRNLKDEKSGQDQLRGIALQGPESVKILRACASDSATLKSLKEIRKTQTARMNLSGISVLAAKTGYTGEEEGYELYVHPDSLIDLWNLLLKTGAPFGLIPCGLAARDSLRTEAGLPLYGHELAGPEELTPDEAGFGGYVKYHKPFFIGREAIRKRDNASNRRVVQWRMTAKGVRKPNFGDPVAEKNGKIIGKVTSAVLDTEGVLTGLAVIESSAAKKDKLLAVFALPPKFREEKQKNEVVPGDRVIVPGEAVILS